MSLKIVGKYFAALLLLGVAGYFILNMSRKNIRADSEILAEGNSAAPTPLGPGVIHGPGVKTDPVLKGFQDYLAKLDSSDIKSIRLAKEYFLKEYSGQETALLNEALRTFMGFYSAVIGSSQQIFASKPEYQKVLWQTSAKLHNYRDDPIGKILISTIPSLNEFKGENNSVLTELYKYRQCGIDFAPGGEGTDWYLLEDPEFVVSLASGIPGAYAEFLVFYYPYFKRPWGEDAGLAIGWDGLAERITRWGRFAKANPTLLETKTIIKPELEKYVSVFSGELKMDNTPVLSGNGEIQPELKNAYKVFLRDNTDSEYYQSIKDAYEKLTANEPQKDAAFDEVQSMIENAKEGDVITIPAGKYNVDLGRGLKIRNKKKLTLLGNGKVELISNSSEQDILIIQKSTDIVIDGLAVYHTVPVGCMANCIVIGNSESVTVQNSDIHGSGAYGIQGGRNKNIKILKNKIHNCSYWGIEIHADGGEISGNTFYDNNRDIDAGKSTDLKIVDNNFPNKTGVQK